MNNINVMDLILWIDDITMKFYREILNRMTINQLTQYIIIARFEQIMFFPNFHILTN